MRDVKYECGSGNIFEDIGLEDPEEYLAKAELAHQIALSIRTQGMTQTQAAHRLGVSQPKVSLLTRGILDEFSLSKLMALARGIGKKVSVIVEEPAEDIGGSLRVEVRSFRPSVVVESTLGVRGYFIVDAAQRLSFDQDSTMVSTKLYRSTVPVSAWATVPAYVAVQSPNRH